MNYYEQIQKSIDYIEDNLEEPININIVANEAYMSQSNYYRMFFAMVGYSVKEYIRMRRISDAAIQLRNSEANIIDIAVKYDFDSRDSFSRAFKKITRFLPSEYRQQMSSAYQFERVNIMEKFYDKQQDGELLEKYPDIRVLKTLEPMKVAYYNYYGRNPEDGAFEVINEWLQDSGLNIEKDGVRRNKDTELGYEIMKAWQRFGSWIIDSKYVTGSRKAV